MPQSRDEEEKEYFISNYMTYDPTPKDMKIKIFVELFLKIEKKII